MNLNIDNESILNSHLTNNNSIKDLNTIQNNDTSKKLIFSFLKNFNNQGN